MQIRFQSFLNVFSASVRIVIVLSRHLNITASPRISLLKSPVKRVRALPSAFVDDCVNTTGLLNLYTALSPYRNLFCSIKHAQSKLLVTTDGWNYLWIQKCLKSPPFDTHSDQYSSSFEDTETSSYKSSGPLNCYMEVFKRSAKSSLSFWL